MFVLDFSSGTKSFCSVELGLSSEEFKMAAVRELLDQRETRRRGGGNQRYRTTYQTIISFKCREKFAFFSGNQSAGVLKAYVSHRSW